MLKSYLSSIFLVLIAIAALITSYYAITLDFGKSLASYVLFLLLFLGYHAFFDKPVQKLFISVIGIFAIVACFRLFYHFTDLSQVVVVYILETLTLVGLILMLREVFRHTNPSFALSGYFIFILLILIVDGAVIQKILAFITEYNLGTSHMAFGFVFTIAKMLLLSIGLIYYLLGKEKSKRLTFLNGALVMFFLSDLVDTTNYMFFIDDLMPAGMFLQAGFAMVGIGLFYAYCRLPVTATYLEDGLL